MFQTSLPPHYSQQHRDTATLHRTRRFRYFPSLEIQQSPNFISQNPHAPNGPHRRLVVGDRPTALVLGTNANTIHLSSDQAIVRLPCPREFNRELVASTARLEKQLGPLPRAAQRKGSGNYNEELNKISFRRRWTSTTREATEESALPTLKYSVPQTTLEACADPVRHRTQKYQTAPCIWQQYAREWDVMQLRHPMPSLQKRNTINLQTRDFTEQFYHHAECKPSNETLEERKGVVCPVMHSIGRDPESATAFPGDCSTVTFRRPMPGYGGFVPRNAVESKPISDCECITASMVSTSRITYRRFPPEEYKELQFAHKGPLSKTVTLTYPFNPFNKTE